MHVRVDHVTTEMASNTGEQEGNVMLHPESAFVDEGTSSVPADCLANRPNAKAAV